MGNPNDPRPAWRVRAMVVVLVAALAMSACGSSSAPPATGPTTTMPSAPRTAAPPAPPCGVVATPGVTITSFTEPCAATTHVGTRIRIFLDPGFKWADPTSDSAAVLVENVRRPTNGGLKADLHTVAVGQATVSTTGVVACSPGKPCPALARLWGLRITVRA